jgi:hypothetical protein
MLLSISTEGRQKLSRIRPETIWPGRKDKRRITIGCEYFANVPGR